MAKKLIQCKTCGETIAKSAKRCPHCGARNGMSVGQAILTAFGVLIALFVLLVIVAVNSDDDEPKKVSEGTQTQTQTPAPTNSAPTKFGVGEAVELNGVTVTLVDVSENRGSLYNTPSDGSVFVVCEFEIENNSNADIAVSSLLSFETYVDDYTTSLSLSALVSTDKTQLDGTIAAGKKMNGVIGYKVPIDWQEIEVRFTPDFWRGKDIVFTYAK